MRLLLTFAVLSSPAAFAMKYAPVTPQIIGIVNPLHPFVNNFSGCSSDSNTVAVGYEFYPAGFRMLCADAGRIGFWTSPVEATLVGEAAGSGERFVCPSSTALAGLLFVEGLIFPFPLCGELIPDFKTGNVHHGVMFSVDKVLVEKESKTGPVDPGVVSCGPGGFVQSLQASRNAAGTVNGFGAVCNSILTDPANIEDVSVDLAVRTVNQPAVLDRNATDTFRVDVFNLGITSMPASNVRLDMLFDGLAWQLQPFADSTCTDILAHKGIVDLVVVGKRCTIATSVLAEKGGVISATFQLQPLGSDVTRPATTTPKPIVTAKVSVVNENLDGADPNATNDVAAFPVKLQ